MRMRKTADVTNTSAVFHGLRIKSLERVALFLKVPVGSGVHHMFREKPGESNTAARDRHFPHVAPSLHFMREF